MFRTLITPWIRIGDEFFSSTLFASSTIKVKDLIYLYIFWFNLNQESYLIPNLLFKIQSGYSCANLSNYLLWFYVFIVLILNSCRFSSKIGIGILVQDIIGISPILFNKCLNYDIQKSMESDCSFFCYVTLSMRSANRVNYNLLFWSTISILAFFFRLEP